MTAKTKAGSIYKQKKSPYWWIKFYVPGRQTPIRESTKTDNLEEAQRYLHRRLGETAVGKFNGLEPERIKVNVLFDHVVEDFDINNRASRKQLGLRLKKHLRPFFGLMRAPEVGSRQIATYIRKRHAAGAANATINRELEIVRRAFRLGFEAEPQLVVKPLKITKLTEDNVRENTLTHEEYIVLRTGLPEPYQTLFVCGYHLGTRLGELSKVQWSEVDLEASEILLKRYNTKGKEPRTLPIYGEMSHFLKMAKERRDRLYPTCQWVFNRRGEPIYFRHRMWNELVTKLGVPELHFHDLRRTAASNLIQAGFSEDEAMKITGHKTRKMFQRYHIIKKERIHQIGRGMEEYFKRLEAGIPPGISGTGKAVTN